MTESPFLGSQRLQVVEAPIIPAVAQWIRQVPGTISLGQGVVGYGPSPKAQEAAKAFGKAPGDHLYGPVAGVLIFWRQFASDSSRSMVLMLASIGACG